MTPLAQKSTTREIQARFDQEVERFSQLETGQKATIDAPLVLNLVAQTSKTHLQPNATILDLGCGAGNFTLSVLQETPGLNCHLVDLSSAMLQRAQQRVTAAKAASVHPQQSDLRDLNFPSNTFDCILAGAVLHHLRDDADWTTAFAKFHQWLKPNGRLYVWDLAYFDDPKVQEVMWDRYGQYLETLGPGTREKVFAYIDQEDSPRSLPYQLNLLKSSGFSHHDVLHRTSVFACYFGVK